MALDPITEGLGTAHAIADIVGSLLDRADRDKPDKERDENFTKWQNAFADNDLDAQYANLYRLCVQAGCPTTPGGDVATHEREFRHAAGVCAIELIHLRQLVSRLLAKRGK